MMRALPFFLFRLAFLIISIALGICGIWIGAAEFTSPRLSYFPVDAAEARIFSAASSWTEAAATIGQIRGELWANAAVAKAAPYLFEKDEAKRGLFLPSDVHAAITAATHAAALSPHDARSWLILASLADRGGANLISQADALKLSYYTGSSRLALTPLRLAIATRSLAISDDDDLKTFVSLEIQQAITKLPDAKTMIASVYANASAPGRKAIEVALAQNDPAYLKAIRDH